MREVSVDTFLEYVRTNNLEAIEAAVRQSGYDIDSQDEVSTVVSLNALNEHLLCHYSGVHLLLLL